MSSTDDQEIQAIIEQHGIETVLQKIYAHPMVQAKDGAEFVQNPTVRKVFGEKGTKEAVMNCFVWNPPLSSPPEKAPAVPAFWLRKRIWTAKDPKDKTGKIRVPIGVGSTVLLADGKLDIHGRPMVVDIRDEQDYGDKAETLKTRVTVGPMGVRTNVVTGDKIYSTTKATKVTVADHAAVIPDVGVATHLKRALERSKREDGRGLILGTAGEFQPVITMATITDDERDIAYFGPTPQRPQNDETLRVVVRDTEGNAMRGKLPIEQVRADYGLDENADANAYKSALRGEPILLGCKIGITQPRNVLGFKPDGETPNFEPEERDLMVRDIEALIEKGLIVKVKQGKKEFRGLNLRNVQDAEGNAISSVRVGKLDAYDIQEIEEEVYNPETGKREPRKNWQIAILADAESGVYPWFDCRPHLIKQGDRKGQYTNEGAFVVFLAQSGFGVKLPKTNPFVQYADALPDFE